MLTPFMSMALEGDVVAGWILKARLRVLEENLESGRFPNGARLTLADRTRDLSEVEGLRALFGPADQPNSNAQYLQLSFEI